jgi:hypothetical protein
MKAEAKRRFSALIDRARSAERFVIARRAGRRSRWYLPRSRSEEPRSVGLAALAGALADWKELDEVVKEIDASRRRARDREVPDLG